MLRTPRSTSARTIEVAETVGELRRSKCGVLRGSLTRASLGTPVHLLGELAGDHVILVVSRDGDDDVRRPSEPVLSRTKISVASPWIARCWNSSSSRSYRACSCSTNASSCPRARSVRTPTPTFLRRRRRTSSRRPRTHALAQLGDRGARGRDDVEPLTCRSPPGPGRGCARRPGNLRSALATCAITMFVLSPSVDATNASASSIPARSRTAMSIPCPRWNSPRPVRPQVQRLLVLVDDDDLPALVAQPSRLRPSRLSRHRR